MHDLTRDLFVEVYGIRLEDMATWDAREHPDLELHQRQNSPFKPPTGIAMKYDEKTNRFGFTDAPPRTVWEKFLKPWWPPADNARVLKIYESMETTVGQKQSGSNQRQGAALPPPVPSGSQPSKTAPSGSTPAPIESPSGTPQGTEPLRAIPRGYKAGCPTIARFRSRYPSQYSTALRDQEREDAAVS